MMYRRTHGTTPSDPDSQVASAAFAG